MRIFLVNFIHTSAGQSYNADFVLLTQETFPTSHEIYKRIKSAAVEREATCPRTYIVDRDHRVK